MRKMRDERWHQGADTLRVLKSTSSTSFYRAKKVHIGYTQVPSTLDFDEIVVNGFPSD